MYYPLALFQDESYHPIRIIHFFCLSPVRHSLLKFQFIEIIYQITSLDLNDYMLSDDCIPLVL